MRSKVQSAIRHFKELAFRTIKLEKGNRRWTRMNADERDKIQTTGVGNGIQIESIKLGM